jgi:hypothetical protein
MRSRELWLWLGGACLTVGTVLAATALAYFTKEKQFSLVTSPLTYAAACLFVFAFVVCFLGAILGWSFFQKRPGFPDIIVTVRQTITEPVPIKPSPGLTAMGIPQPLRVEKLWAWHVQLTNREPERTASIKHALLRAKVRDDIGGETRELTWGDLELEAFDSSGIRPLQLPVNLAPQQTVGGHFTFDVLVESAVDMRMSWIEMEDGHTGLWARFPAAKGIYSKGDGLQILKKSELWAVHYPLP